MNRYALRQWFFIMMLASVATVASANGAPRIALVIGNGQYEDAPLRNPENDARAVATTLKRLGFEVALKLNQTSGQTKRAMRDFGRRLKQPNAIGLFFYAGHGMQVNGQNYLIPVNSQIEDEYEVELEGVGANRVLAAMEAAGNPMNIVILDACRNNPFSRSFRAKRQGLAQMDAPTGSLIAYSTAPGSVAADGEGRHSPYARHLIRAMNVPNLPIEQVFKRARIGVQSLTDGRQTPWESSSLTGNFFFINAQTANIATQPQVANSKPAEGEDLMVEVEFWRTVKDSADAADLNAYLDAYPGGKFSAVAHNRLRRMKSLSSSDVPDVAAISTAQKGAQHPWDGEWVGRRGECKSGIQAHKIAEGDIAAEMAGRRADVRMVFQLGQNGYLRFSAEIDEGGRFRYQGTPDYDSPYGYGQRGTFEFVGLAQGDEIRGKWSTFGCAGGEWYLKRVADRPKL